MRISRVLLAALAVLVGTAGTALAHGTTVTVGPGDTLGAIAARAGTSAGAVASANGIPDPDLIQIGQRLTIPGSGAASGSPTSLTVRPGDTLAAIAADAGTSLEAIVSANGISDPNLIRVGQSLTIPGGEGEGSSSAAPSTVPAGGYRVLRGDTLGGIAVSLGTTSSALASLNGIEDPDRVTTGSVLWVPTAAVPARGADGSSGEVAGLIESAAARHGVDPALARAVAWQESGWNQDAVSSAGAIGVMQLLPDTATWLGPAILGRSIDPHDIRDNVEGGVAYLGWLAGEAGSSEGALASYYQGLTSVRSYGQLAETQLYVANVLAQVGRV